MCEVGGSSVDAGPKPANDVDFRRVATVDVEVDIREASQEERGEAARQHLDLTDRKDAFERREVTHRGVFGDLEHDLGQLSDRELGGVPHVDRFGRLAFHSRDLA